MFVLENCIKIDIMEKIYTTKFIFHCIVTDEEKYILQ